MSQPRELVIVGSGFAALQLVKALRKRDAPRPIRLITADSGEDYHKPDLSHVASRDQSAAGMIRSAAAAWAAEYGISVQTHCAVTAIDRVQRQLQTAQGEVAYDQLVLATGARALRPQVDGHERLLTLNSLQEYAAIEPRLRAARHVTLMGGGLIGCELAMDLASSGRAVTLVDLASTLLSSLLPATLSQPLQQQLQGLGVTLRLGQTLASVQVDGDGERVTLANGEVWSTDLVLVASGLAPNTELAAAAGLKVERGIVVDSQLRTSDPFIYALGDCAAWQGKVQPFLQPAMLGAQALAATLTGTPTTLQLPPMLLRVKTPRYPLQLAGRTTGDDLRWQIELDAGGVLAKAFNGLQQLCGFVAGGARSEAGLALLRELPR